jgi:hypothetical protein
MQFHLLLFLINSNILENKKKKIIFGKKFGPGEKYMTIKYIHVYKTDRHDISEILLKMALNTITLTLLIKL